MPPNIQPVVLMYHGVIDSPGQVPADRETGAELYDLPLSKFKEQMEFLQANNYSTGPIENTPQVIITFDDGEMNNFQNAWPVLRGAKTPAYFFVTVTRVGQKGYMGWQQLLELRDTDMVIGSHGLNHSLMTELSTKQIQKELVESKAVLEKHLKIQVDYFSVPRGFYNAAVVEAARQAGYKKIFVSNALDPHDDFCVGRVAVKSDWTVSRFAQALKGEVPVSEKVGRSLKNGMKTVLGAKGYDQLRSFLLKKKPSH